MPFQSCLVRPPSMTVTTILLILFGAISIILGAIAWTRTTSLYLPFPTAIPATGTFLPMLTLLIPAINTLYNRSSSISKSRNTRNQSRITQIILVPLINALLVILPTIIITLSTTYLVPSDTQICGLERTWQAYFHNKNAPAIRTIQDTLQCCGLRSTRDRAWPFKDGKRYGDDACEVNLGYRRSCLAVWGQEERGVAGLVVGSVVVVFVMKVILHYYSTSRNRIESMQVFNSSSEIENRRGRSDPPLIGYRDDDHDDSTAAESNHGGEEDPGTRPRPALNGTSTGLDQDPWSQEGANGAGGDEQAGSNGPTVHPSGLGGSRPLLD
ncbi:hypothetical protein DTO212C5_6995 [Paecilomyces variotii]|nr:hypothetical protein DTO212C5_6995 [Paecilomyces variotii]